jgi:hypothetical protein
MKTYKSIAGLLAERVVGPQRSLGEPRTWRPSPFLPPHRMGRGPALRILSSKALLSEADPLTKDEVRDYQSPITDY